MEILKELLECTICLEFAISPIHNCSNGHIVCAICIKKVTKCGMCQGALVPCGFAERIVRRHDFRFLCTNALYGCTEFIESTKMISHLDVCEYRPFVCFLQMYDRCDGHMCNMNDFYQHLKQVHEAVDFGNEQQGKFSFLAKVGGSMKSLTLLGHDFRGAKQFDNHIFLTFTYKFENFFIWKVVIIGGKNETKKYQYCVHFKSQSTPCFEFMWKGPVLTIREWGDIHLIKKQLEICPSIPCPAILTFSTEVEKDKRVERTFETNIEISKID